jgi:hypothetical protein
MIAGSSPTQVFTYKLNPTGKELVVLLKCVGYATGSYAIGFERPNQALQTKTGNIEKPEEIRLAPGDGLTKITVKINSVSFCAEDPGSYQIVIEQAGGSRLETPALPYGAEAQVVIATPQ